jgi:NAD(P)-dependent dehydrogenase (short-subunit alcohol dehydrogenase family)
MNAAKAFELTGKNAIVPGGAMGIGFGIVRLFLAGGANLVLAELGPAAAAEATGIFLEEVRATWRPRGFARTSVRVILAIGSG